MMKTSRYSTLRWGLSTLGCPDFDLPRAVELADSYGIDSLEIRTLNGSVDCGKTLYLPENEPVMRRIAGEGRCHVLDSSFGLCARKEGDRELLEAVARTADDFGIPYIRVFGGGTFGEPLDDARIGNARENLAWYHAQGFRAVPALETHDLCSSAVFCARLQEACGEKIPVIWDAHHTFQVAGEPFEESFRILRENIVGIHFKDSNPVVKNGTKTWEYTVLGQGVVPLAELFGLLEREGVRVPVTLEHEKFWRPNLPDIRVMLDSLLELVR